MHWLYLLASIACLALAMVRTMPTLGVLVCLAADGDLTLREVALRVGVTATATGHRFDNAANSLRLAGYGITLDQVFTSCDPSGNSK